MGLYNPDGSIAVTAVDGTQLVGRQAPDGSIYVVVDDEGGYGIYHASGALRVNSSNGNSVLDPSGAYYINHFLGSNIPSTVTPPESEDLNSDTTEITADTTNHTADESTSSAATFYIGAYISQGVF